MLRVLGRPVRLLLVLSLLTVGFFLSLFSYRTDLLSFSIESS